MTLTLLVAHVYQKAVLGGFMLLGTHPHSPSGLKKMNKLHSCGGESWKSAHPSKNWLVSIIKEI